MSATFQGVMNDISIHAQRGLRRRCSGCGPRRRHLRNGGCRAPVWQRRQRVGRAQRLVQLPLEPDYRDGGFDRLDHGFESTPERQRQRIPFAPAPIAEVVEAIRTQKPDVVFAPHVETSAGVILPDDYVSAMAAAAHEVGA